MQCGGGVSRLGQWMFGHDWGIRSIDGSAPSDSVENRTNSFRLASRITGFTALLAVVAIALVPLSGQHISGLHVGWYFALSAVALIIIMPGALLAVRYLSLGWIHLILFLIEAVLMGALAFTLGPVLSPYLAVPYAIYATLDFVVMTRRMAMIHVAGIGASFGLVVALQAGNTAPLTRWIFVVGAVVIIGQTVASLVDRVRSLAESERPGRCLGRPGQGGLARSEPDPGASRQRAGRRTRTTRSPPPIPLDAGGRRRALVGRPVTPRTASAGDLRLLL